MSKAVKRNLLMTVVSQLGWPVLVGLVLCSLFFLLIERGPLSTPLAHRYFAGHPVCVVETALFFVGLVALAAKFWSVLVQHAALASGQLQLQVGRGEDLAVIPALLDHLRSLPARLRESYLGQRLCAALESVVRSGSAEHLDDELKYLADADVARQQESFALVRIIIWATPMLGFLGTVIGITQALGEMDPQLLATDIEKAMEGLLSGLYVAFDTTALALSLSMILMFIQFFVDRVETQLLVAVDNRVNSELGGRFACLSTTRDPYLGSVQKMAASVIEASGQLVEQQVEIWQQVIDAAHQRWGQLVSSASQQVESSLGVALEKSLEQHAIRLAEADRAAVAQSQQRWEQWQTTLSTNARLLRDQQQELVRQGEVMGRILDTTGQVIQLEQALNDNLHMLAGAKNFEDTVMSLAAAIHLLNTRLGAVREHERFVESKASSPQGRAA